MKIRITDIPPEGCPVDFEVSQQAINDRVVPDGHPPRSRRGAQVEPPVYRFTGNPKASFELSLEGSTVMLRGAAASRFISPCARCAEDCEQTLDVARF